jgi:hypothetical protein
MGGSVTKPFFSSLVEVASRLVRCSFTPQIDKDARSFVKRNRTDIEKEHGIEPDNLITTRYELTDEQVEYFTNPDLFEIIVSNDYYVEKGYARALAHLSYGSKERSKKIMDLLLQHLDKGSDPNSIYIL